MLFRSFEDLAGIDALIGALRDAGRDLRKQKDFSGEWEALDRRAGEMAAELGFGYSSVFVPQQKAAQLNATIRERAAHYGHTMRPDQFPLLTYIYVAETEEQAQREYIDHIRVFFEDYARAPQFLQPPGYMSVEQLKIRAGGSDKIHGGFDFNAVSQQTFMAVGTPEKVANLIGVERFSGEQPIGEIHQLLLVLEQDVLRARVVIGHEALDFLIDPERRVFAVVLVLRDLAAEEDLLLLLAEGERAHRVAHAPLAHHAARHLGRALEVVAGAGRQAVHRDLLGDAAAEQNRDLIVEVVARVVVLLVDRELLREAERHAAGNDRDLVDRVGVGQEHGDQRVPGLVDGRDAFLGLADDHRAPLRAHEDLVLGELEVVHPHDLLVVTGGVERRLVDQIGQIGAREADRKSTRLNSSHVSESRMPSSA